MVVSAIVAAGCGTTNQSLNTQLPVLRTSVDDLLAADDLAAAERIARGLERRMPGVDTYALLGRVKWRTGDLVEAEALFRRSANGGIPEGLLGLARSRLARGEIESASASAEALVTVGSVAARAYRLLAAVAWGRGRVAEAAAALSAAADTPRNPRARLDRAEARALEEIASSSPETALGWTGEGSVLTVRMNDMTVAGTLDGRPARLQVSLREDRTAVAPYVVEEMIGGRSLADVGTVAIGLADLTATHVPVEIRDLPEGVDGRLGFDVLSTVAWALDTRSGRLEIAAPAAAGDSAAQLPRPPDLSRTYWAAVRVPRDGLAVQLLLVPRIRGVVLASALDPGAVERIDERALAAAGGSSSQGQVEAEVRLGAWRQDLVWEVSDLYPEGEGGAVAPRAILGAAAVAGWRLYWTPHAGSLLLERVAEPAALQ